MLPESQSQRRPADFKCHWPATFAWGGNRGQMAGSGDSLLLRQGLMNEEEWFSKSSVEEENTKCQRRMKSTWQAALRG